MRNIIAFILLFLPLSAIAQDDTGIAGFILRSAGSLEEAADRLEERLGDKHLVYETIGNHEGHSLYLVLRGKTGAAEVHVTESDYYIGVRGHTTFVIGGELENPKELPRKQIHGTGIKGGERRVIGPGDLVHVPPNTPHNTIIDPDEPYMYLLFKLDEEPLN
ncbi:hypothetical protein [Pseudemcibacter aquimaris]|uniref:hypothetical protein n=1 Tax=Pseudemcibacter aquimaris TaxID=2857064 RepID=UPI00201186D4|nr:hypothetical protein [Pseudemcibacter aquimaris]MCC3860190.1 hypothetical protein [Pseudemcibacter aquimaris]WDU57515.1 hypothetical protein KW060_09945 [Pseudemcibacter aquimaris]